jgi:hypothetical protein
MSMSRLASLVATRTSWHAVAEHVLSTARYAATGRIGLRPSPGGFATPPFGEAPQRLAVEGVELVVFWGEAASRHELTTLRAAAVAAEVDLASWHGLYPAATPADPDLHLLVDGEAAELLAQWFALTDRALAEVARRHRKQEPTEAQLWPEHFDLALSVAQCNLGGSPGDAEHPEPYLYVGPWEPDAYARAGGFWNEPFGASLPWRADLGVRDAVAFFTKGLSQL